jgi:hypothetical protein
LDTVTADPGEAVRMDERSTKVGELLPSPPVTACYKTEFSFYGVVGSPRRMVCPRDATPITPPPTQPTPEIVIPDMACRG